MFEKESNISFDIARRASTISTELTCLSELLNLLQVSSIFSAGLLFLFGPQYHRKIETFQWKMRMSHILVDECRGARHNHGIWQCHFSLQCLFVILCLKFIHDGCVVLHIFWKLSDSISTYHRTSTKLPFHYYTDEDKDRFLCHYALLKVKRFFLTLGRRQKMRHDQRKGLTKYTPNR